MEISIITILVIGARGSIGAEVLDQLVSAGESVRASMRDTRTGTVPAEVPTVIADLADPDSLIVALDDVEQVFLYATPDTIDGFVAAAERAAVRHVVVLSSGSVLLPETADNPIAKTHRIIEEALETSTLEYTPIRPLVLATNALGWSHSIRRGDSVALIHADAATAPIHQRDVAAVAVAALRGDTNPRMADILTGPAAITQRHQIDVIAEAVGRRIRVSELTVPQWLDQVGPHMGYETAQGTAELLNAAHTMHVQTAAAEGVLGRPLATFARWVAEHRSRFV